MLKKLFIAAGFASFGILSLACPSGEGADGGTDSGTHVDSGHVIPDSGVYGSATLSGSLAFFQPQTVYTRWEPNSDDGGVDPRIVAAYISDLPPNELCDAFQSGTNPDGKFLVLVAEKEDGGLVGTEIPVGAPSPFLAYAYLAVPSASFFAVPNDGGITVTNMVMPTPVIGSWYSGGSADLTFKLNFFDADGGLDTLEGKAHGVGCDFLRLGFAF